MAALTTLSSQSRPSEFVPPPDDFTVGWICALPIERAAASCLLDREYHGHGLGSRYTLGRMGEHDVVIACLPAGLTGTNSAASVATRLQLEFKSIQIRLLVGIGGGVPSPADVRLGDVVISQPQHGHGGVVQYDFGKTGQGGSLQLTGFLNAPPIELLDAAAQLRARFLEGKSRLSDHLTRYGPEFSKDQAGPDVLFAADSEHVSGASTCLSCNNDTVVVRLPRSSHGPVVHFGVIASANQVMKDGVTRDRHSIELGGVLCYEMEAAGLMMSFPSLVIRGICDYSDQHKNKSWQPYAAAVASAVAKEILSLIPVHNHKTQQGLDREIQEIEKEFPAPDPSVEYRKAIQSRQPGTGTWLYQDERYTFWKKQASTLWLYGIPGCGKTVLSAGVIEDLRSAHGSDNVAYFYFVFNDSRKQVAELMIRSLVYQLLRRRARPSAIAKLSSGSSMSMEDLMDILCQLVQEFPHTYIVLDALDECADWTALSGALETISHWRLEGLHLLMTSRMQRDLEEGLNSVMNAENRIPLQSTVVDPDINNYIQTQLLERKSLKKWREDPTLSEEIRDKIATGARGMFRWAACQLDQVAKCRNRSQLRHTLSSLPLTLNATYDRILQCIEPQDTEYALRILRWLAFSERPLLVEELAEAVAISVDCDINFDPDQILQDPLESLDICSSLITINPASGWKHTDWIYGGNTTGQTVSLAHYSVKEYLINHVGMTARTSNMPEMESQRILAMSCIAYLSQFCSVDQKRVDAARFSKYCVQHWAVHSQKSESKTLDEQIIKFLFSKSFLSFNRLYNINHPSYPPNFKRPSADMPTPLSVAVYFGLHRVVESMILRGVDVNQFRGPSHSALHMAAKVGDIKTLDLLLASGAVVNSHGGDSHTALHAAAGQCHLGIVRRLLALGASVHVIGGIWESVLRAAVQGGSTEIVERVLAAGADVNVQLKIGTVIHNAVTRGNREITQCLLAAGAHVDAIHPQFGSPLALAAYFKHPLIVGDLIAAGADVNAQGGDFGTALNAAAYCGQSQIVHQLCLAGVAVNTYSDHFGTALHAAVSSLTLGRIQRDATVHSLLRAGAHVNAPAVNGITPLHSAAHRGHSSTVQLLMIHGANINAKDHLGMKASQLAEVKGHLLTRNILQWGVTYVQTCER